MAAPEAAAETPLNRRIRPEFPAPFPGLNAFGFLGPRVPLRSTLGYNLAALSGLKAALSKASRVPRHKLTNAFGTVPCDETGTDGSQIGALKKPTAKEDIEHGEPRAAEQPGS